jgi:proline-specific peptidase
MADLFANVNNIKLCYEVCGEGHPLVLLHGFGQHKGFWLAQLAALSKEFKVILMDNRGSGSSDHPDEPYTMKTLADDISGLLDFLQIDKVHLIGWAIGGTIAQYFTLNYPKRVEKLILISTLTKMPGSKSGIEMFKNSQLAFHEAKLKDPQKAFYDKMKNRFTRNFYKDMVQNPKKKFHGIFSTEDLMEQVIKDTSSPRDIENRIDAVAELNILEKISQISNKTLILAAEKDRITPKSSNIEIHEKLPHSNLMVFEGGHYLPLEKASEVNQAIIEFLKE